MKNKILYFNDAGEGVPLASITDDVAFSEQHLFAVMQEKIIACRQNGQPTPEFEIVEYDIDKMDPAARPSEQPPSSRWQKLRSYGGAQKSAMAFDPQHPALQAMIAAAVKMAVERNIKQEIK